jgi:enoyl-CoA hydratase
VKVKAPATTHELSVGKLTAWLQGAAGIIASTVRMRGVIEIEKRGELALFRMEHGKANTFDLEFCEAIVRQLEELKQPSIRAVVVTGKDQIFSAGVDLPRVLEGGLAYLRSFLPALNRAFETLFCFPKPVVAAINGHAIAGGCVLACATDHRLMALTEVRHYIRKKQQFCASPSG